MYMFVKAKVVMALMHLEDQYMEISLLEIGVGYIIPYTFWNSWNIKIKGGHMFYPILKNDMLKQNTLKILCNSSIYAGYFFNIVSPQFPIF